MGAKVPFSRAPENFRQDQAGSCAGSLAKTLLPQGTLPCAPLSPRTTEKFCPALTWPYGDENQLPYPFRPNCPKNGQKASFSAWTSWQPGNGPKMPPGELSTDQVMGTFPFLAKCSQRLPSFAMLPIATFHLDKRALFGPSLLRHPGSVNKNKFFVMFILLDHYHHRDRPSARKDFFTISSRTNLIYRFNSIWIMSTFSKNLTFKQNS